MKPAEASKPEFDKSARSYETLFKPWLKIAEASRGAVGAQYQVLARKE